MVLVSGAAITGVHHKIACPAQTSQHGAVIRAVWASSGINSGAGDRFENSPTAFEFVTELSRSEVAPRAVVYPMAADAHALGPQLTHVCSAEKCGFIQAARTNEKTRPQAAPQKRREHDLDIGSVAIIERQLHVGLSPREVQHSLEVLLFQPAVALTLINVPGNRADTVKIKNDPRHPKGASSARAVSSAHREGIQAGPEELAVPAAG
jgi:hypothetical protein